MPVRETLHKLSKAIEVKPTDDEYEKIQTTRWGNRDTYPIPHDKRTYGVYAYIAYWGELTLATSAEFRANDGQALVVSASPLLRWALP
jgi:cytosine/uracil/thiamine/allantoin permease